LGNRRFCPHKLIPNETDSDLLLWIERENGISPQLFIELQTTGAGSVKSLIQRRLFLPRAGGAYSTFTTRPSIKVTFISR
jgi:hypothetical protein